MTYEQRDVCGQPRATVLAHHPGDALVPRSAARLPSAWHREDATAGKVDACFVAEGSCDSHSSAEQNDRASAASPEVEIKRRETRRGSRSARESEPASLRRGSGASPRAQGLLTMPELRVDDSQSQPLNIRRVELAAGAPFVRSCP